MADLTITRLLDAPRDLVFRVWTDPDHLAHWWGPTGFTATSCTVNLAEGGKWRICMSNGETDLWASGVYHEIVPPERLVFSFAWEEPAGFRGHDTLVTVTLSDLDGKTEMAFHQAIFETVADRDSHAEGWQSCLSRLVTHLAEHAADASGR
ncbi:SRPBCC domain-containing protein [Amycolatopsis roodepoortensis]|uniref:SRPBCC family protein n=1 Tax=Amycolatopsis roodepoortensis TaxID=700274 RepID=UPI00214AC08F|nr:SRPBCC domain-containing protein [Amycolatopsis roodepoortensis]UUV31412.1 SRPBCC domain-containing protein [Amycolatopsis roodepoortensis]